MILTRSYKGNQVTIPRPKVSSPDDHHLPVRFDRTQFPLRLAFSMTINKSQGQSLRCVGVNLREEVFTHGQLYVALSRATSAANVKVLLPDNETGVRNLCRNVVYREILED